MAERKTISKEAPKAQTKGTTEGQTEKKEKTKTKRKVSIFYMKGKTPLTAETKLAPQAREIVATVHEAKGTINHNELLDKLKDRVTTRQPLSRIVSYYSKDLQEAGFIEVTKKEEETKEAA